MKELIAKAKNIRLVILDIDGVLTDGGLVFDNHGGEYKSFNSHDGHGIRMLLDSNIRVAVITGRQSNIVRHRMNDLGVELLFQGYRDKRLAYIEIVKSTSLVADQIAYIGDDLPDLPVMTQVGLSIAVQNAHGFVKKQADWITSARGGAGAVREAIDFILQAQDMLDSLQASYLK